MAFLIDLKVCFIFSYIIPSFQPIGRLWGLHIDFTSTRTRTGWKQAFFNDHSGGFLQNRENINFPFSLLNIPVLRPRSNGVQYWLWIPERSFAKTRGRRNTDKQSPHPHSKIRWADTDTVDLLGFGRFGWVVGGSAVLAQKSCKLEKNGLKLGGKLCL